MRFACILPLMLLTVAAAQPALSQPSVHPWGGVG